jgi:hypothetical protein
MKPAGRALFTHLRRHAIAYLALVLALGGVSYAAIPDESGAIHACYTTAGSGAKQLYVIDTSNTSSCPAGSGGPMTELTWNAQGQQGPQGPSGPAGKDGTTNALDNGPGALKGPQQGAVGGGDPGRGQLSGVPLVKKLVRSPFDQCHQLGSGDHPVKCTFAATVRCPSKFPVAINGHWEMWAHKYGDNDITKEVVTWDELTITELYNTRTAAATTRKGPDGWTAALATTDFSGSSQPWFGSPPLTKLVSYRVWALCGKKATRKTLGLTH